MAKSTAVVKPNLGLYYDRPKIALNARALSEGMNFRVKEGKLNNLNLGWTRFSDFILNGPVILISDFINRAGIEKLILGTETDLYSYDSNTDAVVFISPRYETGTASANGTAVTGVGTAWLANAKAGDQISFGATGVVDPAATWFTVQTVNNDLSITLTASAGVIGNGAYTLRKLFTGDVANLWAYDIFTNADPSTEDEWWGTNGVDTIVRWNGTDTQVEEMSASLGFTAKVLRVFKNMMLFLNVTQGGTAKVTDMINSDAGKPQNAGAASTGISAQFKVQEGTEGIVAAKQIGDNIAIYSKSAVTVAQFTGDDVGFIFRTAINGFGAIAGNGVADFGNYHEFIGKDSQYTFDGVTVKESNAHVWREIIRQQDPTRISRAFAHFDDENGDLIWMIPSSVDPGAGDKHAAPTQAYTEHYLEGTFDPENPTPFSKRSFPFTAAGYFSRTTGLTWADLTEIWSEMSFRWNDQFFFSAFPFNLVGDNTGKVFTLNTSQNGDGAGLTSFIIFARRAVLDGRMRGLVSRIYPFSSPLGTTVDVTVSLADHAMGTNTINDTQSFDQTLTEGNFFTTHYRRGRFMELKMGTSGVSLPWEISGYDADVKPGGNR